MASAKSLAGRFMRSTTSWKGATAIGLGAAAYSMHPFQNTRDFAMDAVMSTGDVKGSEWDNMILGEDISAARFFSLPSVDPIETIERPFKKFRKGAELLTNPTMRSNLQAVMSNDTKWEKYIDRYEEDRRAGVTDNASAANMFGMRYRPTNDPYVSGSVVFGAYNSRR